MSEKEIKPDSKSPSSRVVMEMAGRRGVFPSSKRQSLERIGWKFIKDVE